MTISLTYKFILCSYLFVVLVFSRERENERQERPHGALLVSDLASVRQNLKEKDGHRQIQTTDAIHVD
jgi:hypothetical protein